MNSSDKTQDLEAGDDLKEMKDAECSKIDDNVVNLVAVMQNNPDRNGKDISNKKDNEKNTMIDTTKEFEHFSWAYGKLKFKSMKNHLTFYTINTLSTLKNVILDKVKSTPRLKMRQPNDMDKRKNQEYIACPDVAGVVKTETKSIEAYCGNTSHGKTKLVFYTSLTETIEIGDSSSSKQTKKIEQHEYMDNTSYKDIDVLLIGKTGNGKSKTGNTILQRYVFESTDSCNSVTQYVQHEYVQYDNRRIKVVDCPGMEDTDKIDDVEETTRYLIEKMGDAVIQHPDGYHAFLVVVRYGGRFTREDKCVIKTLKSIFGEEIISQFSILLMTYGDLFHTQNKTKKSFEQWCSEQTGVIKELMEECGNRVILFDNDTKDQVKHDLQMKKLIKSIDNLQSRGMRYNHEYFQRAVKNREYLLVAVKEQRIQEETNKECSIISCELKNLDNDFSDECIEKLNFLQLRASEIKSKVQKEDNDTNALIKVLEAINGLSQMIYNRLQVIVAFRQKESDLKEERASLLKLNDERMNNLIESYEKKRDQDAKRVEIEIKEMEKKWLEQEERMQANLKLTLDSVESEKNAYQRRIEELEKECQQSKAEAKSQVEESMAELQSSMNELMERESKEKQTLQEELKRMRNLHEEEQKKYNIKVDEELGKVTDSFVEKQKNIIDQHKENIQNLKEREETLIEEKQKINDDFQKVNKEFSDLQSLYFQQTGSFGKRLKNLCALM